MIGGDQMRLISYHYAMQQLIPQRRIPGFMFHQTERGCPPGSKDGICYERDFDFIGYRYSVISNVAHAGQFDLLHTRRKVCWKKISQNVQKSI